MGVFDIIKNFFSSKKFDNLIKIYLKDDRCGNKMKVVLRKSYDIQRIYEEDQEAEYGVKKVVICDKCYHKIDMSLEFDKRYNIINKKIEGGSFISEEEYEE